MIDRCEDPECPGYGQKCEDRGYGYPVCPSQKWFSERFPGSENKPLAAEYRQAAEDAAPAPSRQGSA
jgi:hypothetical protein